MSDELPSEQPYGVCHACIGEPRLKAEIRRRGRIGECAYCGADHLRTVTMGELADRVSPVYRMGIGRADEGIVHHGDNVAWGVQGGKYPSEIVADLIEPSDTSIADRVVSILAQRHQYDAFHGGFDAYDDTDDTYEWREPSDPQFHERWAAFCQALKHNHRFFNSEGEGLLDSILGPVLAGRFPGAVRTLGPEDDQRFIYRAREANDEAARAQIYRQPIRQLSAPPAERASQGRMNAPGISVFYGSFDVDTCVAELRLPVGGAAVLGRFEILRPLRILDLTRLEAADEQLSYFEPDYSRKRAYLNFVRSFHQEIRRPVVPGRATLDYLPTQVVAEYLATRAEPTIDGMIFGSAQITGSRRNIVLFSRAILVEGADTEPERQIRHIWLDAPFDDDEEAQELVYFQAIAPAPDPPPAPAHSFNVDEDIWFGALAEVDAAAPPAPTLRLDLTSMQVVRVRSIVYETDPVPIRLDEWVDVDI